MSDYIKRKDVLNYPLRMGNELFGNNGAFLAGVECVMDYVENPLYVPAADVAPVVHGHWIRFKESDTCYVHMRCSACSAYWSDPSHADYFRYCPNCGAKMDEVTK